MTLLFVVGRVHVRSMINMKKYRELLKCQRTQEIPLKILSNRELLRRSLLEREVEERMEFL